MAPDATPAQSHDINQNCVFNIFDLRLGCIMRKNPSEVAPCIAGYDLLYTVLGCVLACSRHDYWHFLSAVALALFAMLLLDIRVNSWARKNGIQILFEQHRG